MNSDLFRRVPLLVAGLLVFLAFSSSSAFAAGKPIIGSFSIGYPQEGHEDTKHEGTLTTAKPTVFVNPNGASTTYKLEYGTTSSLGEKTNEIAIGSANGYVEGAPTVTGLLPETRYWRISATNSYGTSFGSIEKLGIEYGKWAAGQAGIFPTTYGSTGTFVISFANYPAYGETTEIACSSVGSGTLGSSGGIGDKYRIYPSGCAVYVDGEKDCSATVPSTWSLNERLIFEESAVTIKLSAGCPIFISEQITLPITSQFTLTDQDSVKHVNLPVVIRGTTTFGVHPGTITDSSTWSLTGAASKGVAFQSNNYGGLV